MSGKVSARAKTSSSDTLAVSGILQRKCDCGTHTIAGGECDSCRQEKGAGNLQRAANAGPVNEVPPIVYEVLRSTGQPLDAHTRSFFESHFDHDFSQVLLHTDIKAAESARAIDAQAYTVGRDVVFGVGRYAPSTSWGRRLIAHELTHVMQQTDALPEGVTAGLKTADDKSEREAEGNAAALALGRKGIIKPHSTGQQQLARFSDMGHHIVEEAGLAGAGFKPKQISQTEAGNIERDYSQVGKVLNTLLLCRPQKFGGYKPQEHFDNFMWDAVTDRWRTRGASALSATDSPVDIGRSPIDYIGGELRVLAIRGLDEAGLAHLGNAFHTVEDFFAHSNFVELINGDFRFGHTLMTGSVDSADEAVSVSNVMESVSAPPAAEYYRQGGEAAMPHTQPLSHSRIAKDHPSSRNHFQARRLAALVIQDLGIDVLAAMKVDKKDREQAISDTVVTKVERYLRPPDENDRWWESLTKRDAGTIDRRLDEATRRTPVTVNQCIFSPLRHLEASKDSNLRIPIGVAIPVNILGNQVFIQGGFGVNVPLPLTRLNDQDDRRDQLKAGFFGGIQITGRFDAL